MKSESAFAHYTRALKLERQGRYEDAVKAYQEALRIDAKDADAYVRVGLLLREMGRDDEANKAFQAALTLRSARSPGPRHSWYDREHDALGSRRSPLRHVGL